MTKKIFYEKIGRRYVPVSEYDSEVLDSFPKGATLVICTPSSHSRKYNIEPALAPLIAAGEYALNDISQAIYKATELRPEHQPLTTEQRDNWKRLNKSLGEGAYSLTHGSARQAAEAGVRALQKEAEITLTNPAVRKAYEHFMTIYQLTKET